VARSLTVRLFAGAREAVGASELRLELPRERTPIAEVLRVLRREHPRLAPILAASRLVRNGEYLRGSSGTVEAGDELAIHPPYSGG
jgi:molybdopterin converting factor small subunit